MARQMGPWAKFQENSHASIIVHVFMHCAHVSISIHSRSREKGYGNSRKPLEMSSLLMNLYTEI